MMITLDTIDRRILSLLQTDGSLSVADLADRLGMTAPPCWRRVKRLKDQGILQRQVWIADPIALGLGTTIFATVKLATHDAQATSAFRDQVGVLPEVMECHILLGTIDVLLKIVVPDIKYYEAFFYDRLSQLPGVREVNSSVSMSEVKKSYTLPEITSPTAN
ncbi:Lrp/AsnC family transcriptional regulator [Blastomonas fulva]|uniref:Lrp/AsnC family transcriptional regulator n=1 Tax=Blastomonas fulva TaxID=1550728 RepID=UPI003D2CC64E